MPTLDAKFIEECATKSEVCKACEGRCCRFQVQSFMNTSQTVLEEIKEDYYRLVNGFIKDIDFRNHLIENLVKKYPQIQDSINSAKSEKEKIENIIEFSKKGPYDDYCFFYLEGCLIHKYKPTVCRDHECAELKYFTKLKEENGNQ